MVCSTDTRQIHTLEMHMDGGQNEPQRTRIKRITTDSSLSNAAQSVSILCFHLCYLWFKSKDKPLFFLLRCPSILGYFRIPPATPSSSRGKDSGHKSHDKGGGCSPAGPEPCPRFGSHRARKAAGGRQSRERCSRHTTGCCPGFLPANNRTCPSSGLPPADRASATSASVCPGPRDWICA